MSILDDSVLRQLFLDARTHHGWLERPVDDALLRRLYEVLRMAPTAANSQPVRLVFVRTREAKELLRPALMPGNVDKTMAAPATAIIAYDTNFPDKMPRLMPPLAGWIAGLDADSRRQLAVQNGTLQGAYLILAARALGLDCGPMGGFDPNKVDAAFFPDGKWKSLFLVNLGYGDPSKLYPRNPRLDFEEACKIV